MILGYCQGWLWLWVGLCGHLYTLDWAIKSFYLLNIQKNIKPDCYLWSKNATALYLVLKEGGADSYCEPCGGHTACFALISRL
jgi:hypothetical protein